MPPTPSLEGVWAKLGRADEHLQALNAEAEAWGEREPYTVVREREADSEWEIARLRVDEPPSIQLGLIVGDFFHNLRSSLDALVAQLLLLNKRTPGKRASFPIFERPRDFESDGRRRLKYVRAHHVNIIESLQPYPGRNDPRVRALAAVAAYSNLDKHRAVQPALSVLNPDPNAIVARREPLHSEFTLEVRYGGGIGQPLHDGAEIARLRIADARALTPETKVKVEIGFPFEITFGEGLRLKAVPSIRWYIVAVVGEFVADFP